MVSHFRVGCFAPVGSFSFVRTARHFHLLSKRAAARLYSTRNCFLHQLTAVGSLRFFSTLSSSSSSGDFSVFSTCLSIFPLTPPAGARVLVVQLHERKCPYRHGKAAVRIQPSYLTFSVHISACGLLPRILKFLPALHRTASMLFTTGRWLLVRITNPWWW